MNFQAWVTSLPGMITLIATGCTLLAALIPITVLFIKKIIILAKDKNWSAIVKIVLAAVQEAEKMAIPGADKKAAVIEVVKASCKEAGINCDSCMDDISSYIDRCKDFVNTMKSAGEIAEQASKAVK